ncbi:MAG TPA: hypothetical protein VFS59_07405 [Gemmatimonadaceae bacterium]|nr:hypothetical protein [Gemmatimonadaceae bacterium]
MTPESIPELDTKAFRRAIAAALGLPVEGEPPRIAARRPPAAWDPLGSVEQEQASAPTGLRRAA